MCWVGKVEFHPFPPWVVVISEHFCLYCNMDGEAVEKGRRRADFFFAIFNVRTYHVHEYWDEGKVCDLVEDVIGGREEGGIWVMLGIEVDAVHDVVCPSPHSIVQDGVCLSVSLYSFAQFDDRVYLWLSRVAIKPQLVMELQGVRGRGNAMAKTLLDGFRGQVGPSISFSCSEFCPKSFLLFNVLARGCADSILKGGRYTFPNLISQGAVTKFYKYFFTCAWCCWQCRWWYIQKMC